MIHCNIDMHCKTNLKLRHFLIAKQSIYSDSNSLLIYKIVPCDLL